MLNKFCGIIHHQVVKIKYIQIEDIQNLDIKMLNKKQKNLYKKCYILLKIINNNWKYKWIKKCIKYKIIYIIKIYHQNNMDFMEWKNKKIKSNQLRLITQWININQKYKNVQV